MTNKQKIEALEKGIKSSVTPENLKEKMRTQLAQLKALDKESTSDKKPKFKVGDIVVLKGETTLEKEITSYKQNSKGEFVYKAKYVSKPSETGEWKEEEIEIYVSEKKSKPKKIKPSSATPIKKASKNYYRNKEIKSVTVLENGKKVTYAGKDVLNGANFFKEGGALVSKATYVPIRNIVEVTFEDGSKDKPRNGYHIKNGATPIMEHGGAVELPEGSLQHFQNYYLEKGGKVDKEYSLIGAKVTSDIRKQSGYVTGYNENYVDIYYPSLEFGESVLYKGQDQQNVMIVKDKPSLILNSVLKEDEFDNYFIEEIVEESTPIDYEGKDNSILIVLLRPKVSHKKDVYFDPNTLILTQKGFVYKISNTKSNKWDEIVNDAEKDKLTYERYGYVKVGNFLKEEYKLGGALLSAWKRERKYVNKSEDYEVRYAKGKNRSGYKKYADGGEVGDYAKVPVGYNMTHYGLIKKVITNDVLYPENGYEIAGIGDILHPEQFEVISSAEFNKLKKQGTEVKPNHFLIIEETKKPYFNTYASLKKGFDLYQTDGNVDTEDFLGNYDSLKEADEAAKQRGLERLPTSFRYEKGGVLSKGDEVKHLITKKHGKVISVKELNGLEDEVVVEFEDGTTETLNSFDVEKVLEIKAKKTYDPNSGLTLEEWKAKHNIQNYGKGGATEKGQGKGAIFAIAKEIRKPGEKWQDAVARAGKLNK